jgi:histidine phosphotransferase ChpT
MDVSVDLTVFELLASRLCHDLVSPVGAVKSGLELFTEFGDDGEGETMALITNSAEQASQKLQCFRLAYGEAGAQRSDVTSKEAVGLVTAVCGNARTQIVAAGDAVIEGTGSGQLLVNMALSMAETMGRGGVLTLAAVGPVLTVAAVGESVSLDAELVAALDLSASVDAVTPKSVQGYFTGMLVRRAGYELRVEAPEAGRALLVVNG